MDGLRAQDRPARLEHITGVILLLDDVIYDRQDWLIPALCFAASKLGMDPDRVAVVINEYTAVHGFADSGIYNHILLSFGQSDSVMNIRAFNAWVNRYKPTPGSLYMHPGVPDALSFLKNSYELALMAQGAVESQKALITALDCTRNFNQICFSDEIDGIKSRLPDERGLRSLINRMYSKPGDILFVGNNPRRHFATPRRVGCTTVRCLTGEYGRLDSSSTDSTAQYSISSAARLPALFGQNQAIDTGFGIGVSGSLQHGSLDHKAHA